MDESLIEPEAKAHRVYAIRWWLLVLCSLIAGNQGGTWLIYGVIAEAVKPLYPNWTDATIALISQWGPICYLVAAWPTSYLLDERGLRSTAIISSGMLFAGGLCRCVHHATDNTGTILVHTGQIFNGLVGPVAMSIAPPLSAQWFSPNERVLATAIAATANYGGTAVFFALGSVCVPPGPPDQVRDNLWKLMLGMCVFSGALFAACILTFPSKPPSAPSRSATVSRASPLKGLRRLATSGPFWLLTVSFGTMSGVFQSWGSMLGPILQVRLAMIALSVLIVSIDLIARIAPIYCTDCPNCLHRHRADVTSPIRHNTHTHNTRTHTSPEHAHTSPSTVDLTTRSLTQLSHLDDENSTYTGSLICLPPRSQGVNTTFLPTDTAEAQAGYIGTLSCPPPPPP